MRVHEWWLRFKEVLSWLLLCTSKEVTRSRREWKLISKKRFLGHSFAPAKK
jgi:hypothetical protein